MNCATIYENTIMADLNSNSNIIQESSQLMVGKMTSFQIQALKFLAMNNKDLRDEILKEVSENPALEIVFDPATNNPQKTKDEKKEKTENNKKRLENTEAKTETLQEHLLNQLNAINLTEDESFLCKSLICNLDKDGCYGSMLSPQYFLNKTKYKNNLQILDKCIQIIQKLDPIGLCCTSLEESLFVQAKIRGNASKLTLFILDNNLELINPPEPEIVEEKILDYMDEYYSLSFTKPLPISEKDVSIPKIKETIQYILTLNPRPASNYSFDESYADFNKPDIVLNIEKIPGYIERNDFENGLIKGNDKFHFQVKYASGDLPIIKISEDSSNNKIFVSKAKLFIKQLQFRESTIALQGCAIVDSQKKFFLNGPEQLQVLTQKKVADICGISESTVSRMAGKNTNKYFQCEWGIFPANYFFPSGVGTSRGGKISSEVIKQNIKQILSVNTNANLSDSKLTSILNKKGIKISRRTVSKYRNAIGINNSYSRNTFLS